MIQKVDSSTGFKAVWCCYKPQIHFSLAKVQELCERRESANILLPPQKKASMKKPLSRQKPRRFGVNFKHVLSQNIPTSMPTRLLRFRSEVFNPKIFVSSPAVGHPVCSALLR